MKWHDRRRSDNVEDRRFQTAQSSLNLQVLIPIIRYLAGTKFGRVILIVGVIAMFLGFNPLAFLSTPTATTQNINEERDTQMAEFIAVVLAETEDVWNAIFSQSGSTYKEPNLVLFRGAVNSGCGFASSQVGPFYCPADMSVYIDLGFFDELAKRHDAPGDFAAAYVVAHEVGHHVQQLTGVLKQADRLKMGKSEAKQNEVQVRIELMADCYAGVWAYYIEQKELLDDGDIDEALNAASMIGDDVLQKKAYGRVMPDSFTHGSAKQRSEAFHNGFKSGNPNSCKAYL